MASIQTTAFQARDADPEPAWETYLVLTDHTNRLAEYVDGKIEVLPMPTTGHQEIVFCLLTLLRAFISPRKLGRALMAPLRVKISEDQFREPDILFMLDRNLHRAANRYWEGADLAIEVISEDDPNRDLVEKRRHYAEGGVSEYWIVDPRVSSITGLRLEAGKYVDYSSAAGAGQVRSALLPGFVIDVGALFAAVRNPN
jgi:Uma2 family endonuclease